MAVTPQNKSFPALHFNGMPVITDPKTADEMRAAGWYGEPVNGSSEKNVLEAQHIAAIKAPDQKRCFVEMSIEQATEFLLLFKDSKYFGTPYMYKEVKVGPPIYEVKQHSGQIIKKPDYKFTTDPNLYPYPKPDPALYKSAAFQKAYYADLSNQMTKLLNKMPVSPFTSTKDDSDEITEDF